MATVHQVLAFATHRLTPWPPTLHLSLQGLPPTVVIVVSHSKVDVVVSHSKVDIVVRYSKVDVVVSHSTVDIVGQSQ